MRPVVNRRKLWLICIIGGTLGSSFTVSNGPFSLTESIAFSLFSAIVGAVFLGLGYLLIVYLLGNYSTVKRKVRK